MGALYNNQWVLKRSVKGTEPREHAARKIQTLGFEGYAAPHGAVASRTPPIALNRFYPWLQAEAEVPH